MQDVTAWLQEPGLAKYAETSRNDEPEFTRLARDNRNIVGQGYPFHCWHLHCSCSTSVSTICIEVRYRDALEDSLYSRKW